MGKYIQVKYTKMRDNRLGTNTTYLDIVIQFKFSMLTQP